jgi:hypothetical protein
VPMKSTLLIVSPIDPAVRAGIAVAIAFIY